MTRSHAILIAVLTVATAIVAPHGNARAQCTAPPANMVSWYRMEGSASDWLGRNNPSSTSAISFVVGEVGQGITYGAGGFVDVPDSTSLTLQALTIDAWARPDGPGPNTGGMQVVAKNTNANDVSVVIFWTPDDGGHFGFDINSPDTIVSTNAFPAGTFYHVAATYDGATMRLYVNGTLEATRSVVKTILYTASIPWVIGANNPPARGLGFPRTWNGVIDEVEIFDRPLLASEIAALYAAGPAGKCPCGDNVVDATEECDDGNLVDGDGCDSNCTITACGNGVITAGEQCDDGNLTPNDGCSATCQLDVCANLQALSGISLWLRAGVGMTVDGSNLVSQWTDQSGLAHDATAAGAARPLYLPAGPSGCPAVQFNGSSTVMDVAGKLINSRNAFTLLIKSGTDSSGTSTQELISNWSNPPSGYKGMFFGRRDGTQWGFTDDWTPATGSVILMDTNTAMTFRSSATDAEIFQDGLLQTQKGSNLTGNPGGLEIDENAPWVVGEQGLFNGEYLKGYIQEIVVFDRVLTEAERMDAEQCLAGCGVYITVPQPTGTATATPTPLATATPTVTPTPTITATPRVISGKKLLIKDKADNGLKRKIIFLSKDPSIVANDLGDGSGVDPATDGAMLEVYNANGGSDHVCFPLPSTLWQAKNASTLFKYKDATYSVGPCKTAQVKNGKLLKIVCQAKVQPIDYALDEASQGAVAVRFSSGGVSYCADFGGVIKKDSGTDPPVTGGKGQFSAKDAPAPAACPTPLAPCQ